MACVGFRMVKRRQRLLGKLFCESGAESSRSPRLVSVAGRSGDGPRSAEISASGTLAPAGGKPPGVRGASSPAPTPNLGPVPNATLNPASVPNPTPNPAPVPDPPLHPAPNPAPATEVWDMPHTGEKVFVFRFQPESQGPTESTGGKRGKKRNFLNFKKGSIAPQDQ